MKATVLAVSCFLVFPLMAQENIPQPPQPIRRPFVQPGSPAQMPEDAKSLQNNITIRLHGTTTNDADIDLSLTGIGPVFNADQILNDGTMLRCQYVVSPTDTGYRVYYSVSARIKVPSQPAQNPPAFEYHEVSLSGNVLCNVDSPQVLIQNGTKPLKLTISKDAQKAAPAKGDKPSN